MNTQCERRFSDIHVSRSVVQVVDTSTDLDLPNEHKTSLNTPHLKNLKKSLHCKPFLTK